MEKRSIEIFIVATLILVATYVAQKNIGTTTIQKNTTLEYNNSQAKNTESMVFSEHWSMKTAASFPQNKISSAPLKYDQTTKPASDVIKGNVQKNEHKDSTDIQTEKQAEIKNSKSISDDEAKKIIPYPFNLALNIFEPEDRINYQKFSDANESDDWDIKMQAQLTDAIYSNPQSPALTLDSASCKAHICELRIFAKNTTAWPLVFSDIQVAPWWSFKNSFSVYEFGIQENSKIKTVYFVLMIRTE